MSEQRVLPVLKQASTGLVVCLIAAGLLLFLVTPTREAILGWFNKAHEEGKGQAAERARPAELIHDGEGHAGLRLSADAMTNLEVNPVKVEWAVQARPMPPQIGTVNYDNDRLFTIRPRFPGELVEIKQVEDVPADDPYAPKRWRP